MARIIDESTDASKASEDLAHGQIVIITARWILILSGLVLAVWAPSPVGRLRIEILLLLLLAVGNFYLQAQVLMQRQVLDGVVYAASAADMAVITLVVLIGGRFDSDVYVFYFPAILAFSVAFPATMTLPFVLGTTFLYGVICLDAAFAGKFPILVARLLMLVAVAVCGNLYWRIERDRRQAAVEARGP